MRLLASLTTAIAWMPATAFAQTMIVDQTGAAAQVMLLPLDDEQTVLMTPAGSQAIGADVGLVHGAGTVDDVRRRFAPSNVSVEVGFDYLVPFWGDDEFRNLLPGGSAGVFPATMLDERVDHDFNFVPRVDFEYEFEDSALGVKASGKFINLKGNLQQTIADGGPVQSIDAESSLTFLVANLAELSADVALSDMGIFCNCRMVQEGCLSRSVIGTTIGLRYASIEQNFLATLRNGAETAVAASKQRFSGIGLTGSMQFLHPVGAKIVLYSDARGSFLVGDNAKDGNYDLDLSANPAANVDSDVHEDGTDVIPVLELEAGFVWNNLSHAEISALAETRVPKRLVWLKVGAVGQYWGNVGMLAAGSPSPYRGSGLGLVGFTLQAGIER